ncbi:MAG: hypothetical protein H6659_19160 [Ardenticatenaceae bacterium]|nr:hypothetical protein [Ardenticatenaceae bacterium]MCB8986552.1 hypothetical protein [Ardenticatenaceae bacterium]
MFVQLHDLMIELHSQDRPILAQWSRLFAGWLRAEFPGLADLKLELSWQETLPPLPSIPPFYNDAGENTAVSPALAVYRGPAESVQLHFHDAGLVTVPLAVRPDAPGSVARGTVVPVSILNGRFEDVTVTSLAPLLRRRGYFLLHAFGAVKEGRAILLVGASGSGKTTSGLRLLLDGWELLSNDVVLLEARADGAYALAMPDIITIRPFTLQLLPRLREHLAAVTDRPFDVSAETLTNGRWANPAPITAVYFPQITGQSTSTAVPLSRAVCLAHLMEQSIDQWDTAVFPQHLALLQRLSQQAAAYTLRLGQDLSDLPRLLAG